MPAPGCDARRRTDAGRERSRRVLRKSGPQRFAHWPSPSRDGQTPADRRHCRGASASRSLSRTFCETPSQRQRRRQASQIGSSVSSPRRCYSLLPRPEPSSMRSRQQPAVERHRLQADRAYRPCRRSAAVRRLVCRRNRRFAQVRYRRLQSSRHRQPPHRRFRPQRRRYRRSAWRLREADSRHHSRPP